METSNERCACCGHYIDSCHCHNFEFRAEITNCLKRIRELEAEVKEWKHRAIGGTCRILSAGDECDCSLCARDKRICELEAQIELHKQLWLNSVEENARLRVELDQDRNPSLPCSHELEDEMFPHCVKCAHAVAKRTIEFRDAEIAQLRSELERRTLKWTSEPMRVGLHLVRDKRYRQSIATWWLMNNITDGATLNEFSEHAGPIEPPEEP